MLDFRLSSLRIPARRRAWRATFARWAREWAASFGSALAVDGTMMRYATATRTRALEVVARVTSLPAVVGVAIAGALWLFVVVFSTPGEVWLTAREAACYWIPTLADPYRLSSWTSPVAYVYSPAFLQLILPLKMLPWTEFVAAWTGLLIGAVFLLSGRRLLWFGVLAAALELIGGNISLFLAVAIVAGFRWPAAWAFVLLTKVTPGVGLLWFAVRREWHQLVIAFAATAGVVVVSALVQPAAWLQWLQVLAANAGRSGTWAAVPVALTIRLPIAILVVIWGARTGRRWTVPVASMLALPALWYGSLSMMLALIRLAPRDETNPRADASRGDGGLSALAMRLAATRQGAKRLAQAVVTMTARAVGG